MKNYLMKLQKAELPGKEVCSEFLIDGVTSGTPNCDAIFITHYHGDHAGLFNKVLPEIPIYMGETAKKIYFTLQTRIKAKGVERIKAFKTFKALDKILIGDITVTPLSTDHSAFDAYMFLIECDGKRILHTGDFRTHGIKGKGVLKMLKKYVGKVDTLICEGTQLSRDTPETLSEHELKYEIQREVKKNTFLLCSSTNFDRIGTFYNLRGHRPFVCDEYQKEELEIVAESAKDKTNYYSFNEVYSYKYENLKLHQWILGVGIFALIRNNEFSKKLLKRFYDPENSVIIYSMWKGYIEPENPACSKGLIDFLAPYENKYIHTSGHATKEAIQAVIDIVKPKEILPIHTENPKAFEEMFDNCKIPEKNNIFEV